MLKIKPLILAVDDETSVLETYKLILEDDYTVITSSNGMDAINKVNTENIDIVLLDILMPGMDGIQVLKKIKEINMNVEVVIVTAVKTVKTAIEAMKLGAYDYITKPFDVDDLLALVKKIIEKQRLEKEVVYFRTEVDKPVMFENIIGTSEPMKQIYELINEMGKNDTTVTIYGESGTGKELTARAIHFNGTRAKFPFIAVDCAAIPENLLESELFGHEKGAFTDATSQKTGKFELANNGTMFLDEIGNLKMDMQAKLLRALQEREIQRVGGIKNIKIDVRIICATNIDLKKAVSENRFREDLYYRVNVVPIFLPSLSERKTDIPLLIEHFIKIYNKKFNKQVTGLSEKAMSFLANYAWPGNVRELRNVVERLIVLGKEKVISQKQLPLEILLAGENTAENIEQLSLKKTTDQFEKKYIIGVLEKMNWNQTRAAEFLGIHRNTLILKIKALNIKIPH